MKALTLRQPWAALVAQGTKTIETRSWKTNYRGPLAIHAGLRKADVFKTGWEPWIPLMPGYPESVIINPPFAFGAIIATCELVDVVPIGTEVARPFPVYVAEYLDEGDLPHQRGGLWLIGQNDWAENPLRIEDQRPYGDFTPGRYAWLLGNIERLDEPVPVKGRQGLWNVDL